MKNAGPHPDATYLAFNPFEGDRDVDIRRHKVMLVEKTRKAHRCAAGPLTTTGEHEISVGSRAWKESAIVDNRPGSCYCCLPCLDLLLDELYGDDGEEEEEEEDE